MEDGQGRDGGVDVAIVTQKSQNFPFPPPISSFQLLALYF